MSATEINRQKEGEIEAKVGDGEGDVIVDELNYETELAVY